MDQEGRHLLLIANPEKVEALIWNTITYMTAEVQDWNETQRVFVTIEQGDLLDLGPIVLVTTTDPIEAVEMTQQTMVYYDGDDIGPAGQQAVEYSLLSGHEIVFFDQGGGWIRVMDHVA